MGPEKLKGRGRLVPTLANARERMCHPKNVQKPKHHAATTRSTHRTDQIQDHYDEKDCSYYPHAPACAPSGISVIAAASAEQKQQKDD